MCNTQQLHTDHFPILFVMMFTGRFKSFILLVVEVKGVVHFEINF